MLATPSLLHKIRSLISLVKFPVLASRELCIKQLKSSVLRAQVCRFNRQIRRIPCKFPVLREINAETGSPQTASTTTFSPVLQQEIGGVQQRVFQRRDQHGVASASAIGINEEAGIGNRGAVGGEAS